MVDEPDQGTPVEPNKDLPEPTSPVVELPTVPTWAEELAKLDPQEFRKAINKHPGLSGVIGGIIGAERDRAIQEHELRRQQQQQTQEVDEQDEDFFKLVEENEDWIKQNRPKTYQRYERLMQQRASKEVEGLKGKTVGEIGMAIGHALADVPEWANVSQEDKQNLAMAVYGKSDVEALAIFNREAWKLISEARAQAMHGTWKSKELEKEREAIRQEEAAKLMSKTDAPNLVKPTLPGKPNINSMSKEEFEKYWEALKVRPR